MKKQIILFALLLSLMTAGVFPLQNTIGYASESSGRKIVTIVFDDSFSMANENRYSNANYAIQAFIALLNEEDELHLIYMSDAARQLEPGNFDPSAIAKDIDLTNPQSGADQVRNNPWQGAGTPFGAVQMGYNELVSHEDTDSSTQYYLIVLSDGGFMDDATNQITIDTGTVQGQFESFYGTLMPNQTHMNTYYLAIGAEAVALTDRPDLNFHAQTASDGQSMIHAIGALADTISGRYRLDASEISVYDKHCLSLSKEEVEANLAAGKPWVIRLNVPNEGETTFHDEIYGDITVPNAELDDMILIKSDGFPTYNFANVIDDHLMEISHVVRGNEYLSSAPKYNRLYEAFGWEVPVYVHCPLITDENHKKLSKRCGHSSYEDLIEQGYVSEAVVNYVALLGWCPTDNREIFSLEELVEAFDYHHMSKSPAVFDTVKLKWMNGEYLKAMDFDKFYALAEPYLKKAVTKDYDLKKIATLVKTRIEILPEIKEQVDFFEELPDYDIALYTHKKMKTDPEKSLALLNEVLPVLEAQEDFSNDALFETLKTFATEKGYKVGYVMWPLRTAVSGKQNTPGGATELMEVLGKDESLRRIRLGIEKLQ